MFKDKAPLLENSDWGSILKVQDDSSHHLRVLFFPIPNDFLGRAKPEYLQVDTEGLDRFDEWFVLNKPIQVDGVEYTRRRPGFLEQLDSEAYVSAFHALNSPDLQCPQW